MTTINGIELEPCPFCGSDDIGYDDEYGRVICECSAGGPFSTRMQSAIELWNKRTPALAPGPDYTPDAVDFMAASAMDAAQEKETK